MAAPEPVAPGVHRVRVPMPGGGLPSSNAYLIEDDAGRIHIVDPGSPTAAAREALGAALARLGSPVPASIVLTHLHADHAGSAAALGEETGAPVALLARERDALVRLAAGIPAPDLAGWGVPPERRSELLAVAAAPVGGAVAALLEAGLVPLADGDEVAGGRARVVATPGHTPGHVSLRLTDADVLLTGDHILPGVNPGIGLGGPVAGDPIADALASLDRVAGLDTGETIVLPGHGDPFIGLRERAQELAAHHRRRTREVAERPEGTVWDAASGLTWTGGWAALSGFTLLSALSQTALHRAHLEAQKGEAQRREAQKPYAQRREAQLKPAAGPGGEGAPGG